MSFFKNIEIFLWSNVDIFLLYYKYIFNILIIFYSNIIKEIISWEKRKKYFNQVKKLSSGSKGKTWTLSDEAKKNISESKKGVPKSKEERIRLSITRTGAGNPNYGRKHSPETKEKMRQAALKRKLG